MGSLRGLLHQSWLPAERINHRREVEKKQGIHGQSPAHFKEQLARFGNGAESPKSLPQHSQHTPFWVRKGSGTASHVLQRQREEEVPATLLSSSRADGFLSPSGFLIPFFIFFNLYHFSSPLKLEIWGKGGDVQSGRTSITTRL